MSSWLPINVINAHNNQYYHYYYSERLILSLFSSLGISKSFENGSNMPILLWLSTGDYINGMILPLCSSSKPKNKNYYIISLFIQTRNRKIPTDWLYRTPKRRNQKYRGRRDTHTFARVYTHTYSPIMECNTNSYWFIHILHRRFNVFNLQMNDDECWWLELKHNNSYNNDHWSLIAVDVSGNECAFQFVEHL